MNQTPFEFVVGMLAPFVGVDKLPAAVRAVLPMLVSLASSEEVLTDDRRASLQKSVLLALRSAGLKGTDIG